MTTLKLYDFAFSPNCRKVRAVAYELGLPFETSHVELTKGGGQTPDYLALNPNGRVPTLVDDGYSLWESTAIMRYLSSKKGNELIPATAQGRADMDKWMAWQLAHLGPAMSKVAFERIVKKLTGQGTPDEAAIAAGSADFAKLTRILDHALAGREYLAGTLSLADFALAAHYSLAPMCGLELSGYANVNAWLERVLSRPSMKRALADAHATVNRFAA
jgi:glutathione S-transferase